MFSGKVVLITGASSEIGTATARQFAELGASLALTGKSLENLENVASKCSANKVTPLLLTGDLTDDKEANVIVDQVIEHFGKLDVLVNAAELFEMGTVETTSLDQFDMLMNINVRAVYHLTLLSVPHLRKTKGNIINVSSINAIQSFPGVLGYCVSKAALDQFTRSAAFDLASSHVRVNSVNPEAIFMNLCRRSALCEEKYESFIERSKKNQAALGKSGFPTEVAKSIVFLASDDASFITGITMSVNGRSP